MNPTRRGFLKLLGAAAAVPIVAQAGVAQAALPRPAEIVLPAGSVVETLALATAMPTAEQAAQLVEHGLVDVGTARREYLGSDDEWDWRERYRHRVMTEIEREAYAKITCVLNLRSFVRPPVYGLRQHVVPSYGLAVTYELGGPLIPERTAWLPLDALAVDEEIRYERRVLTPRMQARALATLPTGFAHAVADAVADQVRQDVLAQLLALRAEHAR